ncbi:MAG TPA: hypothetical protein VIE88_05065 [Vicinamibacteria bacterium]
MTRRNPSSTRRGASVFRTLLGFLAFVVVGLAVLYFFFGLRAELDGTGARPIFSFRAQEAHDEELERSRTERKIETPAPAETPPPVEVAPVPEDVPVPPPRHDWPRFRGPGMDGHYEAGEINVAWPGRWPPSPLEAARRWRVRLVRDRGWARVHHRAAPGSRGRGRLRLEERARNLEARMGGGVSRDPGGRRPAGDSHSR